MELASSDALSQFVDGEVVHVVKGLVLAAHGPDEGVVGRAAAGVQGPGGRNHGLIVLHDNVAGLLGLTHQMQHDAVFRQVEVSVDLHSPLMGVGRDTVPDAARLQLGQAHGQLAGLQHIGVDELIDDPLVGGLHAAQGGACWRP